MLGTIINIISIVVGGIIGMTFGKHLPQKFHQTVLVCMGLFTGVIGIQMFFKTENSIIVLGGLLIGSLLGEWWRMEDGLKALGFWMEEKFTKTEQPNSEDSLFVKGFLTASLLFIIGPIAILGPIQDGISGDYSLLVIKSVLDGFASLAFSSTLGIGVLFSAIPLLIYQGSITLLAEQAQRFITPIMMNEMTATGGVLLVAIAISNLLQIKHIRVGNILPALAISPLIVYILSLLK